MQKLIRSSLKGFVCDGSLYLACFLLIRYSFLRVVLRFSHVVGRLFDVVFDLVDHLALQEAEISHQALLMTRNKPERRRLRCLYLSLHLHGEVLEHVVQVSDAPLQLQDLVVSGLDLVQSLLCGFSIDQDLNTAVQIVISYVLDNRNICRQSQGVRVSSMTSGGRRTQKPIQACKNTQLQVKIFNSKMLKIVLVLQ